MKTDVSVDLYYSGSWHDITADVYTRNPITVTRGRPDQAQRVQPSTLDLTLDNRDGTYSPRNPVSPLYGLIGRNTPIRVSVDGDVRFAGEVESWPQRWAIKGDSWAPVTAYGIMRRLGAGGRSTPAMSALARSTLVAQPSAYWTLEDGTDATQAASSVSGIPPMTPFNAEPSVATGSITFGSGKATNGSLPIVDLVEGGSLRVALPDTGEFTDRWTLDWVAAFPIGGDDSFVAGAMFSLEIDSATVGYLTTDAGPTWRVFYGADRSVFTGRMLPAGADLYDDGLAHHFRLVAQQSGGDISITGYLDGVEQGVSADFSDDGLPTGTLGRVKAIFINQDNPEGGSMMGSIGHLTLWYGDAPDMVDAAAGWANETAAARIERLCEEEVVSLTVLGDPDESEMMGPQRAAVFLDLLQDAADVDGGVLFEARDELALHYRTRSSLQNQDAAVTLAYDAGDEVAPPLEPVEDTDATANDVTVTRLGGSSARVTRDTGPLNTQTPTADPQGVGRYAQDVTLNLATDSQCLQQAGWRVHLGTWDEARYPVVNMDLGTMLDAGKDSLAAAAASLDIGDRLSITDLPAWLPPDSIEALAQGFTEVLASHRWTIAVNAVPALPYEVTVVETGDGNRSHVDGSDTTLNEALDTTETGVDIISTANRWTDSTSRPGDFPHDVLIGGERMTVTAVSGTGLTQTMTVTRSVNGVVKSHAAGTPVQVFRPAHLAL